MIVNIKNREIDWLSIVGKEFKHNLTRVVCSAFVENKLYIQEWVGDNLTGVTSVISTIDSEKCIAHLKIFGYQLTFEEKFYFSIETIQKVEGLILAGFKKLKLNNDNYTVDDIFQENFLTLEEKAYLLNNNIAEIFLKEII